MRKADKYDIIDDVKAKKQFAHGQADILQRQIAWLEKERKILLDLGNDITTDDDCLFTDLLQNM